MNEKPDTDPSGRTPGNPSRQLRRSLRQKRQAIAPVERERYSLAITEHLLRYRPYQRARHIAFYMPTNEEVDTRPAIDLAVADGKTIYLPVINTARWRREQLLFQRYVPGASRMVSNQFGIPEPVHLPGESIRGQHLDLVCVPLVGFNEHCDRIGMGAGYYDRAFSRTTWRRTHLVGLAFSCQAAVFTPADHDVPMHAIVTEAGVIRRNRNRR